MNKVVRLGLLTALVLSLLTFGLAGAQTEVANLNAAVTYTTGFQVRNLESAPATGTIDFYKQSGEMSTSPLNIPGNSSVTYFPIPVDAPFNGSAVISSDKDIRAVSNLLGSGPGNYLAATNGFQAGSTAVSLPLVMCNNSGFDTFFNVQNAGLADANITINYVPGSNGTAGSETAVIKPGAAKTFDQTTGSATRNCSTLADGTGKFVGSAKITSDQPIVAAVMQLNTGSFKILAGYGGFTQGSSAVALPLVMANNSGFYTGIQVQNAGTSITDVTITYAPNTAGTNNPVAETFSLAAGASKTVIQNGAGSPNNWNTIGKYIGGAVVSNSGSQPLVAIVNQVRPSPALGSAYEGFDPVTATSKISAPLIMANNSTYFTGIQVQNVSLSSSVDVTITYGPNTAGSFAPANEVFTLQPAASKTVIQSGGAWGANKYIGSATVTASGSIVAIVNQLSLSVSGDQFATSDAFNY